MRSARTEFEAIAFTAVKELLNKTGVQPRQIGIVITNSSLFNTTPSLSATIMNHFKMSSKTLNYNLAGMGCSAGEEEGRGRGRGGGGGGGGEGGVSPGGEARLIMCCCSLWHVCAVPAAASAAACCVMWHVMTS